MSEPASIRHARIRVWLEVAGFGTCSAFDCMNMGEG